MLHDISFRNGNDFQPWNGAKERGFLKCFILKQPLFAFSFYLFNFQCRMDNTIALVKPTELSELLELIRELARFEHLEHQMEATESSLHQSFFGPQPAAGALLARCDGQAAGYAIYFFTFSSFLGRAGIWLEDVYVRPQFRKRGLGRKLIEAVARIGVERGCGRFEWTALDWNEPALNFYRRLGAQERKEWVLIRMEPEGLKKLGRKAE
jgi:GNAT superfamily N-acetyltransferase